jgi:hypothetical protein
MVAAGAVAMRLRNCIPPRAVSETSRRTTSISYLLKRALQREL